MNMQILEINSEKEHLHALIEYPPKLSVSKIVNAFNYVATITVNTQMLKQHINFWNW